MNALLQGIGGKKASMEDQCVNACPDDAMKYKWRIVSAVRDYPEGCGRFVGIVPECSVQSKISDLEPLKIIPSLDSIGKEDERITTSGTPFQAEDSHGKRRKINPEKRSLKVLDYEESIRLSKNSVQAFREANPNCKFVPAIQRRFPQGYPKTFVSSNKVCLKAITAAKIISTQGSSRNDANPKNITNGFKCAQAQKGKEPIDNNISSGKLQPKLHCTSLLRGATPSSLKPPARGIIVQGLMAAPIYSYRKRKRAFT